MCDHYFLEFAGQKSSLYFDNRKLSILFIEQNESYQIFINIIFICIIFMPKKITIMFSVSVHILL